MSFTIFSFIEKNRNTCLDFTNVNSSSFKYSTDATRVLFPVIILMRCEMLYFIHFLPPGVACTTGLSHNPFTWRPL